MSHEKRKSRKNETTGKEPSGEPTLFIGIDLGTSRTAVSASSGRRVMLSTLIGKPRDEVSRKLFGQRLLFGDEALRNRLSLDLYRPLEKGVLKRSKANLEDKKILIDSVRGVLDAVMIVSERFCAAYGQDLLTDALTLDIGAGTMDLCRMHGTLPSEKDQETISKAGDYIDRTLFDLIEKKHPDAQCTLNMVKNIKETHGYVSDKVERIEVEFTVNGRPRMFDITDEIKQACLEIVPDLKESIYKLIGTFDPEFQKRLRENVVACGGGSQMTGLAVLIERALDELGGGKVGIIDEPAYAGANGALMIAREIPRSFWEDLTGDARDMDPVEIPDDSTAEEDATAG